MDDIVLLFFVSVCTIITKKQIEYQKNCLSRSSRIYLMGKMVILQQNMWRWRQDEGSILHCIL